MLGRFTDSARAVVRDAFLRHPGASERDILLALSRHPRGLARRLLAEVDVEADRLPPCEVVFDRPTLVGLAVGEARRRGDDYVGTEHVLIAVARRQGSALARLGADAERLDSLLPTMEAEWREAHPSLARRIGAACRSAWRRLSGRDA